MSSSGARTRFAIGTGISLLVFTMLVLATPLSSQTDSTATGMSTREKLLRLMGDSTAPATKAPVPAVKPALPQQPVERGDQSVDRSVSPVTERGAVASLSAQPSPASSEPAPAPRGGDDREKAAGVPSVKAAPPSGPVSGGSSALWWQIPAVVAVAAIVWYLMTRRRHAMVHVFGALTTRLGFNSLRGRLVLMTVGLITLTVAVTGYVAFDRGSSSIVDGLQVNFQNVALSTMDKIDRGLMERYGDVQAFVANPLAINTMSGKEPPDRLRAFANEMSRLYGVYDAMIVVDRSGKVVATANTSHDGKRYDTEALERTSFSSADWFKACISGQVAPGSSFAGEPVRDKAIGGVFGSNVITVPFAAPIRDKNGAILGVWCNYASYIAVVQSITDETIAFQRANGFPSFRVTIIDRRGLIIDDDAEKDILTKNLATSGSSQCVTRVMAGENGSTVEKSVRFGFTQVNGFAFSKGVGAYAGHRWGLLVRAKTEDALAPVQTLRTTLIVVGLAIVLIGVGLVYLYTRRIIAPIRAIATAADRLALGDVHVSVAVTSKDEVGQLASSFVALTENMRQQAGIVEAIAAGTIDVTVSPRSNDDVVMLALRNAVGSLQGLLAETRMLSRAAVDGKLATRGNAEKFQGGYREIVQGVNETLDAVIGPLNVAAEYVDRISKGDIPTQITDKYSGDFNEIKNNLNQAIVAVNAMVTDASMLSQAAVEGRLATRADARKHGGEFRRIVEGVNATLDSLVGFIDSMPVPVMVIDRDRTVLYMNKIGAAAGGRRPEELYGKKCFDHFRTDHCSTGECACMRAVATGKTEQGETTARPGANELEISYTGVPIKDGKHEVVGVLEIVVDQTAVRKAQKVADKVAAYQRVQVEILSEDLHKLSAGDLGLQLFVAPGDADTAEVRANFETINERLGLAREAVTHLVQDATMLAEAAVAGNLATRADALRHDGEFRRIVQGVNDTLDAVIKPVQEGSRTLAMMATGDLTARMQGDYRGDLQLIKESINKVGTSLVDALRKVSEAVSATASASSQISSSTEEMAAGAMEQTSQAGEVASAVEEMTKTIQENSRNASVAAETAKQARLRAEQGGKVVTETVDGMKRIAGVVHKSAETVRELGRSSDQIGEIISVIDDIADQTNLLALNAAIEAARAGDQGRGFAVVADEVRKLAERTTKATKEIADMIKKIQSDTNDAVRSMEEGTNEVERGIALADRAGSSLQEIVGVSQQVTDMVGQIAAANEEQSSASEQISKNVESISKVTGETAQGTQQIARAAEDLNRLTDNLQRLITAFTGGGARRGGGRMGGPRPRGEGSMAEG
ncbi:MAG: HAMP domain-containing protein [Ignavibacteriae bacterium]|nr:HAMP domain-containing protein [Ignavibacteriota bacterium]